MSRLSMFELYDTVILSRVVRAFRSAEGDHAALVELVTRAEEPRYSKTRAATLRKSLVRLRELQAPELLVEDARRTLEPRALLLERLAEGHALREWELYSLAARDKRPLPRKYTTIEWLLDEAGRREGPPVVSDDGWIPEFRASTPSVREALFGAGPLLVDGRPTLGQERAWVLDVAAATTTRRLIEDLLTRVPPPLEEYRTWYRHLHALEFTMNADRPVPDDGPLAWDYARSLTQAAREATSMASMLRT
jgi:hypothetical protein